MALTFAMVDFGYALMLVLLALILSGIAALMHRRDRIVFAINTVLYALFGLLSFLALVLSASSAIPLFSIFSISAFSLLFFVLFSFGIACVSVISYKRSEHFAYLSALMSFAFLGMVLVSASGSFVTTILGLELVSVSSAFMILLDGKSGLEASTKLFIIGAIAAAVMIFALALIFPFSGSLSFALAQNSGMNYILLTGILLFIVGLSFESGIFPFNLWIPDVYEGAKANVTAFISGLNENVGFAAIITVFFVAFVAYAKSYYMIFEILSIFTMFFGNIVAIVQKNVKLPLSASKLRYSRYSRICSWS
jgi:NADH-quinone oxidoreductase subunit N